MRCHGKTGVRTKIPVAPPDLRLRTRAHAAVDIVGVKRLRLVVTDAGDGNRFDAADWAVRLFWGAENEEMSIS